MADDFLGSLQGVLQNEIEQQQSTDWGSILANALTQGAKGAAAGFAEAKPTDYGSQLAAALVGGLSSGYGQARQRNIRNDILGGLSSSIDATKAGQYQSLAEALKANELSNLANAVTTDNYNFDLGLGRAQKEQEMKNKLALALTRGQGDIELDVYNRKIPLEVQREKQIQNAKNQATLDNLKRRWEMFKSPTTSTNQGVAQGEGGGQGISQQPVNMSVDPALQGGGQQKPTLKPGKSSNLLEQLEVDNKTLQERKIQMANEIALRTGATETQALQQAEKQLRGEQKALDETFKQSSELLQNSMELKNLSRQARALINTAGSTGGFRGYGTSIQKLFKDDKEFKAMEGMETLKALQFALTRVKGTGAVSDRETEMYLSSGVRPENQKETNILIAQRIERLGQVLEDRASFLNYMRRTGNFQRADELWQAYMDKNPLIKVENGSYISDPRGGFKENTNRQTWQEFLQNPTGGSMKTQNETEQEEYQRLKKQYGR